MDGKQLPRMKLALILVAVAVVVACEEEKEDGKCPESCCKHEFGSLDFPVDRFIPKKLPNKYSVTIFNCQRESQFKVTYEGDGNETESAK